MYVVRISMNLLDRCYFRMASGTYVVPELRLQEDIRAWAWENGVHMILQRFAFPSVLDREDVNPYYRLVFTDPSAAIDFKLRWG